MGVGDLGGGHDLLGRGVRLGVGDVLGDGAGEEERLLEHDAELAAVGPEGHLPQGDAVDEDLALIGVVEPAEQVDDGALAGPALAHQAEHLALLDPEGDVLEHLLVLLVAEANVAVVHLAAYLLQLDLAAGALALRLGVQHLEDALGRPSARG